MAGDIDQLPDWLISHEEVVLGSKCTCPSTFYRFMPMGSTPTKSTSHEINSNASFIVYTCMTGTESMWGQEVCHFKQLNHCHIWIISVELQGQFQRGLEELVRTPFLPNLHKLAL